MKLSLIGRGKTGSQVEALLRDPSFAPPRKLELMGAYGRSTPPSKAALRSADALIVFVPAPALRDLLPLLLELRKPCVIGTTGFVWNEEIRQAIHDTGAPWILGSNFSLGMNLLFTFTKFAAPLLAQQGWQAAIHEVHHTAKLDRPSGTARTLAELLAAGGLAPTITDVREGDVHGIHEVLLRVPNENLRLRHEVNDRRLFAEGAIFAALEWLREPKAIPPGLHGFEHLFSAKILQQVAKEKMSHGFE